MGYPFQSSSAASTAKCAYCGLRFDARRIFYKSKADAALLTQGIAVIAETLPKRIRIIETYCSLYHARRHKALTLAEHSQWERGELAYSGTVHTEATHCKQGHVLIPENCYVYGRDKVCKLCSLAYSKAHRRSLRENFRNGRYSTLTEAS